MKAGTAILLVGGLGAGFLLLSRRRTPIIPPFGGTSGTGTGLGSLFGGSRNGGQLTDRQRRLGIAGAFAGAAGDILSLYVNKPGQS